MSNNISSTPPQSVPRWKLGLRGRVLVFLSSFLAVDRENTADDALEAFLSGEVIDMQSRLNFLNLVKMSGAGATAKADISEPDMQAFTRLYEQLGLPLPELETTFYGMTEFRIDDPDGNRLWVGQETDG